MEDIVDLVHRSLEDETFESFATRVDEQAGRLREAIRAGEFDNDDFAVGLEVELYAIRAEPGPVESGEDPEERESAESGEDAADGEMDGLADDVSSGDDLSPGDELAGGESDALEDLLEPAGDDVSRDGSEGRDGSEERDGDVSRDGSEERDGDVSRGGSEEWDGDVSRGGSQGREDDEGGDGSEATDPTSGDEEAERAPVAPEDWEGRLAPVPESVFGEVVAKELGVHNAEVNTDPNRLNESGLGAQTTAVELQVKSAREAAAAADRELVLDAMWTIPPAEGTAAYLGAVEERDGLVFAENMRQDPRYVAIDNDALRHAGGEIELSLPGAEHAFPTILFESLTTSIQPHLQVPASASFPAYYDAAIRTMGPVLSLTTNSPFLPSDLYNRVDDPAALLAETHHELRIAVFEQSVNTSPNAKVRVPADVETTVDVVDRLVADDTFAPFLREWMADGERETLADEYWELDHKRGTFWRWLRCVVGGDPVENAGDEASLRIEYRPIPTQPTVADLVGAQALVTGLIRGLVDADHPVATLPWEDARDCLYSAARDGPHADLAWVTADGERTTDRETIYDELFAHARRGLAAQGVPDEQVEEYLEPMVRRRRAGETPSTWKIDRVREYLDEGHGLEAALHEMQRDYFELSREHEAFADWL